MTPTEYKRWLLDGWETHFRNTPKEYQTEEGWQLMIDAMRLWLAYSEYVRKDLH